MSPAWTPDAGSLVLRDGLVLLAPGGLYVPDERALVVADTHVGYAPTLRAKGYGVPSAGDDELLERVRGMLLRMGATRVIVAGDLAHGAPAARAPAGAPSPLEVFARAIAPRALVVALGNHDRRVAASLARLGVEASHEVALGPHRVLHGDVPEQVHEARALARAQGGRAVLGHLHPALALDDGAGAHAVVPAFVTAPGLVCLPALSPFSRGLDVRSHALRAQLDERLDPDDARGVAAVVAKRVLAIGDVWNGTRAAAYAAGPRVGRPEREA